MSRSDGSGAAAAAARSASGGGGRGAHTRALSTDSASTRGGGAPARSPEV